MAWETPLRSGIGPGWVSGMALALDAGGSVVVSDFATRRLGRILAFLFGSLLLPCAALATSTGLRAVGAIDPSSDPWLITGTPTFTLANLQASDDNWARTPNSNLFGIASTFGLGIPTGSTILGLSVEVLSADDARP